ncbi:hypothetical protein Q8F55_005748 [Vanrija albida]|uniref:NIPSNAP domain-containing protein n=1 Tax=Vanrija albida TaxID=181172 RepID=A0ABR3Q2J2_9TREE
MLRRALIRTPLQATRRSTVALPARGLHATQLAWEPSKGEQAAAPDGEQKATNEAKSSILGSLFYGSDTAKAEGDITKSQHSKVVGRGKYVHELITHAVIPGHRDAYVEAAEKYFAALIDHHSELGNLKVSCSFETIVGDVGNFNHILEYDGYKGYDQALQSHRDSKDLKSKLDAILPHIQNRQHQIISEFSFWPSSPPYNSGYPNGGVFELRTYQLQPGKLLEWEFAWRRGLEARRQFVEPVGAFFSQIGDLHHVMHIWHYPSLEARKETRESAWSIGGWSETVRETARLAQSMSTEIMVPTSWSPLR